MNEILIEYRSYLIALFIALIPVYFAVYIHNRNRFNAAADKFRSTVLNELKGIVPVEGFWNQEIYIRIKDATPNIKRAAFEFLPAVPYLRKSRFNKAVMTYCEQSENINWIQAIADAADETPIEETQKGKFVKCVFHLLSFTE